MSEFSFGKRYLNAIGSFWTNIFQEKIVPQKLLMGQEIKIGDLFRTICENIASLSLRNTPIYSEETWKSIKLLQSEQNQNVENKTKYGDDISYGEDGLFYGGYKQNITYSFTFPYSDSGNFIQNKIQNPSKVLIKNKDFFISNNVITFTHDIFSDEYIPIKIIYDTEGNIIDREASLWIPIVYIDNDYLYKKFGCLFLEKTDKYTKEEYKNILISLDALHVNGPKKKYMEAFLNTWFRFPIVLEDETIEYIIDEDNIRKIITRKNTYNLEIDNYIKPFNVGQTINFLDTFYASIKVINSEENKSYINNNRLFTIPMHLLDGSFNSSVYVDSKILSVENELGNEIDVSFNNGSIVKKLPIYMGLPNFMVSDDPFTFSTNDYVLGQLKNNILFIEVNETIDSDVIDIELQKILDLHIPVYSTYIFVFKMNQEKEELDLSTNVDDSELEIKEGHSVSDIYTLNYSSFDGCYGPAFMTDAIYITDDYTLGDYMFMPEPYIFIKE